MKDIHSPATLLVTQGDLLIHADIQLANYVMQRQVKIFIESS